MILCVLFFQRQSFFTFILLYSLYFIIMQVLCYFLWDHLALLGYFESLIPITPALGRGICNLANYSVAYEKIESNRVSDFRDFVCPLFPKAILSNFYSPRELPYFVLYGFAYLFSPVYRYVYSYLYSPVYRYIYLVRSICLSCRKSCQRLNLRLCN